MASKNRALKESVVKEFLRYAVISKSSALHPAVAASVAKINEHANDQPHDQANPCLPGQVVHQVARNNHAHDRHKRHPRRPEWTLQVRIATADNPDTGTDDDKRKQRADVHHDYFWL